MSLIPRRPSSISRFLRKTLSILVWMASGPIFLGFNRTPYEHSFYLLLSKNNQVINDRTKPRNNPLCARLLEDPLCIYALHALGACLFFLEKNGVLI
ncbi:hypothetical protein HU200_014779 [Digitaria exilis]|uniref:Uncharacterized protein n=1 Tax=Digitaria exilis TaxID=1010633 RepID=A0A835KK41_9POAL|nr:hypothetical protein HU200_014779 [Digitaria exilis]